MLKQVCPHDGKDEIAGNVEVEDVVLTEVLVFAVEELFKLLVVVVVAIVEELNEELITALHVPHSG